MQTSLLNKKCSYRSIHVSVPHGRSTVEHTTVVEGTGIIVACEINSYHEFQFLIQDKEKNKLIAMSHYYVTLIEE